jgi:hypothetical protein
VDPHNISLVLEPVRSVQTAVSVVLVVLVANQTEKAKARSIIDEGNITAADVLVQGNTELGSQKSQRPNVDTEREDENIQDASDERPRKMSMKMEFRSQQDEAVQGTSLVVAKAIA